MTDQDLLRTPELEGWISTLSGKKFHFGKADPSEIFIEDIAHGLSHICRWTGQIEEFYSVAQHSVLASQITDAKFALAALMHDASEAYLGDVSRPLKHAMPNYRVMEDKIMSAIAVKFGFDWPMPPEIKQADTALLYTEHMQLRGPHQDPRIVPEPLERLVHSIGEISCWSPSLAKKKFLKRFHQLTEEGRQANMFEEMERERQRVMAESLPTVSRTFRICSCGHERIHHQFSSAHGEEWGACGFCKCQEFDLKVTVG